MPGACFQSMTLGGIRSAKSALGHCQRVYAGHGKAPDYLLPIEHRGENLTTVWTHPEELLQEIKSHGKLHHSAKPFREAVILLDEANTDQQIDACIESLCLNLGIRKLYASVHNDEGHIKDGEVIRNRHLHLGYTNWTPSGSVHVDKVKLKSAQDIVAKELGLERGRSKSETRRKHIGHKTWRMMKQAGSENEKLILDHGQTIKKQQNQIEDLTQLNAELRQQLKDSEIARQADYQALKKAKDADDIEAMQRVVDEVKKRMEEMEEKNEALQKELEEERSGRIKENAERSIQDHLENSDGPIDERAETAVALTHFVQNKDTKLQADDRESLIERIKEWVKKNLSAERLKTFIEKTGLTDLKRPQRTILERKPTGRSR